MAGYCATSFPGPLPWPRPQSQGKGPGNEVGYCVIMDRDGVVFHKLAKNQAMPDVPLGNHTMTSEIRK